MRSASMTRLRRSITDGEPGALHIRITTDEFTGLVQCEKMSLLDMNIRGYTKTGRVSMPEIIDITDAIQSIFDYVYRDKEDLK